MLKSCCSVKCESRSVKPVEKPSTYIVFGLKYSFDIDQKVLVSHKVLNVKSCTVKSL